MTKTAQKLKSQLLALSSKDREQLARFLYDSLEYEQGEWGPDESDEWVAELDRRMQEVDSGKDPGKPVEQVFAEIRERFSWNNSGSSAAPRKNSTKPSSTMKRKRRG